MTSYTINQCWVNAEPLSTTLSHQWHICCGLWPNAGSTLATVYDVAPTSKQRWLIVLCLLGGWDHLTHYIIPMLVQCWPNVYNADTTLAHHWLYVRVWWGSKTDPMLVQCWTTVYEVGPTLTQHWVNASCFLWAVSRSPMPWLPINRKTKEHLICAQSLTEASLVYPVNARRHASVWPMLGRYEWCSASI